MGQNQSQTVPTKPNNIPDEPSDRGLKISKMAESRVEPKLPSKPVEVKDEPKKLPSKPIEVKTEPKRLPSKPIEVKVLPYNYENIIKDADTPINFSSIEKLYDHLHDGVFLNQKRIKYWIEKESGSNCFMLYAKDLSITWAEERNYWRWLSLPETQTSNVGVGVDVAELVNVCWLEIHGKFNTSKLSPKTTYEIVFVVMLNVQSYGWEVPVNVRLILPDGETKQQRKETLSTKPSAQWIELVAGEFHTGSSGKQGEMQYSLFEYDGGHWKKGLVVKGVAIRPKK